MESKGEKKGKKIFRVDLLIKMCYHPIIRPIATQIFTDKDIQMNVYKLLTGNSYKNI